MSDEAQGNAEVGGDIDRASANLAVYAADLEPDEISAALGCAPTRAHKRGHVRKAGAKAAPHGMWLLRVEGRAPTTCDDLMRELLARVPSDPEVWERLRARYRLRLGFGVHTGGWNRGFELGAEVIRGAAVIGVGLDFDLYMYGDEEEPALH